LSETPCYVKASPFYRARNVLFSLLSSTDESNFRVHDLFHLFHFDSRDAIITTPLLRQLLAVVRHFSNPACSLTHQPPPARIHTTASLRLVLLSITKMLFSPESLSIPPLRFVHYRNQRYN